MGACIYTHSADGGYAIDKTYRRVVFTIELSSARHFLNHMFSFPMGTIGMHFGFSILISQPDILKLMTQRSGTLSLCALP